MLFKQICVCLLGILMTLNVTGLTVTTKRLFVKTKNIDMHWFKQNMEYIFNYEYKYSIMPNTLHVFEYTQNDEMYKDGNYLRKIVNYFHGKVVYIEPITWSTDVLRQDPIPVKASSHSDDSNLDNHLVEGQSYGMGVQEVWKLGYNGSGVVIASADVGVDIDNPDLNENININLSHNFESDDKDLSPKRFAENNERLPEYLTDHGNRCCGLLAAIKDNKICCAGIAYGAEIAVLKIFTVVHNENGIASNSFMNEYTAEALNHELQKIDIYSNSWSNKHPFSGLGLAMKDIIEYGINKGRQGKGNLFVHPTGPIAEGFANNRHTITVSSIDKHGGVPSSDVEFCAAVITSAYGESVRENGNYIVTTSHPPNNCTLEFQGTSASTAMIAGIIALALQANGNLSGRDVQHLIVIASHKKGLLEAEHFKPNAAGHYYHPNLGFGLLDANHFVKLAIDWQNVGPEVFQKEVTSDFEKETKKRDKLLYHTLSTARVTVQCKSKNCVTLVEHVEIELSYKSPNENNLEIALLSPAGTQSILMDVKQSNVNKAVWRSNVKLLSVQLWDESVNGIWELVLKQNHNVNEEINETFGIMNVSITVYGTNQGNVTYESEKNMTLNVLEDIDIAHMAEEKLEKETPVIDGIYSEISEYQDNKPIPVNTFTWANGFIVVICLIPFLLLIIVFLHDTRPVQLIMKHF